MSSAAGDLIKINLAGGVSGTEIGAFGSGYTAVYGLATADNGVVYGVDNTTVFSVNTATGAGTEVANYGGQALGDAGGTAFYTEAGASAPGATSTLGLLGCALIAVGTIARTFRKSAGGLSETCSSANDTN
jgi:hypothetical protein